MNESTVRELIRCGADMRRLQKLYLSTRERTILHECMGCEKHFDDLLEAVAKGGAE